MRPRELLRRTVPAALVAVCVGAAAYVGFADARRGDSAAQPNAQLAVPPGYVAVSPPVWAARRGTHKVVVPAQAVAHFPWRSMRQPESGGDWFVQVLRFDAAESDRGVRARPLRSDDPPRLRFRVQVRAVVARSVGEGHVAIDAVQPGELVATRYVYALGSSDLVSGVAPSMRLIDIPTAPVDVPVTVDRLRAERLLRVRVQPPEAGWRGVAYAVDGSGPVALRPRDGGRVLQAVLSERTLGAAQRSLLDRAGRPALNVGWITVRDREQRVRIDNSVRY